MCFDIFYNSCLKHVYFLEEMSEIFSYMYMGLHVKYPLFVSYFNETWIFSTEFRKILNYKIALNTSSGSPVVPCGRKDRYDEANSRFSQLCPKRRLSGCHSHCGTDVAIQTANSRHITDIVKQLLQYRRLWSLHVINRHSELPEPKFHHYIITSLGLV